MAQLNKIALRDVFRAKRKNIPEKERVTAAESAATHFLSEPLFQQSESIALYLANDGEMDCSFLIKAIWRLGKKCYLPVMLPSPEKKLFFAKYHPHDTLSPNRYGILEPQDTAQIPPEALDLVILPLVAFDRFGHRLGMGGGYYDKTFSFLREEKKSAPVLIGLAYAAQEADQLPAEEWDVPLSGVLTECGLSHYV